MSSFDIMTFIAPPKSARPMVRWWWPGLDVDKEELLRQIKQLPTAREIYDYISEYAKSNPGYLPEELLAGLKRYVGTERMYGNAYDDCILLYKKIFSM